MIFEIYKLGFGYPENASKQFHNLYRQSLIADQFDRGHF